MTEYRFFDFLILQTAHQKCTDPRDRVFALLSLLCPEDKSLGIEADYSKSVSQVYQEVFISYCKKKEDLQLPQNYELVAEGTTLPTWVPNWDKRQLAPEGFASIRASASSGPNFEVIQEKTLRIYGVKVATIERIIHHNISRDAAETNTALFGQIRNLALQCHLESSQLEAFCSTLFCDFFSDRYYPENTNYPNRQLTTQAIINFINDPECDEIDASKVPSNSSLYLRMSASCLEGRSVFTTSEGPVGIATICAEPGDIVVVLLGCYSMMLLRPCGDSYKIIGSAYYYGYMYGEALLGPMPETHKVVYQTNETDGGLWPAHLDIVSGKIEVEDPRLRQVPLPAGWRLDEHDRKHLFDRFVYEKTGEKTHKDPRLTVDSLAARGVPIRSWDLI
jgi:hypothetical protein